MRPNTMSASKARTLPAGKPNGCRRLRFGSMGREDPVIVLGLQVRGKDPPEVIRSSEEDITRRGFNSHRYTVTGLSKQVRRGGVSHANFSARPHGPRRMGECRVFPRLGQIARA